ncbi:hypothetical protein AZL_007670 [Azospirillum sp. B510]|nr:hypothetical protein AZL_007670 [Azospirillum sp. B510]
MLVDMSPVAALCSTTAPAETVTNSSGFDIDCRMAPSDQTTSTKTVCIPSISLEICAVAFADWLARFLTSLAIELMTSTMPPIALATSDSRPASL